MEHRATDSLTWNRSPEEHFTGSVWNTILAEGEEGALVLSVQFSPGARTDWHTHPGGQVLYVVSGAGLIQTQGGQVEQIAPGDAIWAPPGEMHWHGARPDSPVLHLSITTGGPTEWAEKVGESEYSGA